jgi:DUF438 domain-containing protein
MMIAEQELFNRGVERPAIEKDIESHISLLAYPTEKLFASLPACHIVKKLISEHYLIQHTFDEFGWLRGRLLGNSLQFHHREFKSLLHIASHLNASSSHDDSEQEIIFPHVEKLVIDVIPRILRMEQLRIRNYSRQFHQFAFNTSTRDFIQSFPDLETIALTLFPLKKRHMLIEERLLYPTAMETVTEKTWQNFSDICDEIGFCCM